MDAMEDEEEEMTGGDDDYVPTSVAVKDEEEEEEEDKENEIPKRRKILRRSCNSSCSRTISDAEWIDRLESDERKCMDEYAADGAVDGKSGRCTACGNATVEDGPFCRHVALNVTMCRPCAKSYSDVEWTRDDDGFYDQCRWCGDSEEGTLMCCWAFSCHEVFCRTCIVRNMGEVYFSNIENSDDWKCFSCDASLLREARAAYYALCKDKPSVDPPLTGFDEQKSKKRKREKEEEKENGFTQMLTKMMRDIDDRHRGEVDELKDKNRSAAKKLDGLKKRLEEGQDRYRKLQSEKMDLEEDLAKTKNEFDHRQSSDVADLASAASEMLRLKSKVQKWKDVVKSMEEEKRENEHLMELKESLSERAMQAETSVRNLEEKLQECERVHMANLEKQKADYEENLVALKREFMEKKENTEKDLTQMNDKYVSIKELYEQLQNEKAKEIKKLELLLSQAQIGKTEHETLTRQLQGKLVEDESVHTENLEALGAKYKNSLEGIEENMKKLEKRHKDDIEKEQSKHKEKVTDLLKRLEDSRLRYEEEKKNNGLLESQKLDLTKTIEKAEQKTSNQIAELIRENERLKQWGKDAEENGRMMHENYEDLLGSKDNEIKRLLEEEANHRVVRLNSIKFKPEEEPELSSLSAELKGHCIEIYRRVTRRIKNTVSPNLERHLAEKVLVDESREAFENLLRVDLVANANPGMTKFTVDRAFKNAFGLMGGGGGAVRKVETAE